LIQNLDQYILFNDTSGLLNMPFWYLLFLILSTHTIFSYILA
jgi:hypothetical protein